MSKTLKSITQTRINFMMESPGKPEESEWIEASTYTTARNDYDQAGQLIRSAAYNSHGEVNELYEYEYDEAGRTTRELLYYEEDVVAETRQFFYSDGGKEPAKERVVYEDGTETLTEFTYDDKDRLIRRLTLAEDGLPEETETLEYDGENLIRHLITDEDGETISLVLYDYDEQGRLIRRSESFSDETSNLVTEYGYDDNGFRSSLRRFDYKNRLIEKAGYENDSEGNAAAVIEETRSGYKKTIITRDAAGNIVLQEETDREDELITRIERSFSDDGDVLESTVFIQGRNDIAPQYYTIRYDYEYHPAE